jgi:hypothetical protein
MPTAAVIGVRVYYALTGVAGSFRHPGVLSLYENQIRV